MGECAKTSAERVVASSALVDVAHAPPVVVRAQMSWHLCKVQARVRLFLVHVLAKAPRGSWWSQWSVAGNVHSSPPPQEFVTTAPWLARMRADGTDKRPYEKQGEDELCALVMDRAKMEADIRGLKERRLVADGQYLRQTGRRKWQRGTHCLCHSGKEPHEVWLGCQNKGDDDDDRGECRHETGWFHPRCVGLGEQLRTTDDVDAFRPWTCPCCRFPEARADARREFLGGGASDSDDSDSDSGRSPPESSSDAEDD